MFYEELYGDSVFERLKFKKIELPYYTEDLSCFFTSRDVLRTDNLGYFSEDQFEDLSKIGKLEAPLTALNSSMSETLELDSLIIYKDTKISDCDSLIDENLLPFLRKVKRVGKLSFEDKTLEEAFLARTRFSGEFHSLLER